MMNLKKWAYRASLGYFLYLASGMAYQFANSFELHNKRTGHYNKPSFLLKQDIGLEKLALNQALRNNKDRKKRNIELGIVVHEHVKAFFDDLYDPYDDSVWVRKIISSMEGLKLYEDHGINFVIKDIYVRDFRYECLKYDETNLLLELIEAEREKLSDADLYLFFMPEGIIPSAGDSYGFVEIKRHRKKIEFNDEAVIFLNWSDKTNEKTVAHEMGHLLGLSHPENNKKINTLDFLQFLIDPYELIPENIMRYGNYHNYKISSDDEKILEKTKEKYK